MKKRIISLAAAVVFVIGTLAGCGNSSTQTTDKTASSDASSSGGDLVTVRDAVMTGQFFHITEDHRQSHKHRTARYSPADAGQTAFPASFFLLFLFFHLLVSFRSMSLVTLPRLHSYLLNHYDFSSFFHFTIVSGTSSSSAALLSVSF